MPEFILDHGTPEATKQFNTLDAFTQGYVEAIFFTNTGNMEDGDLEHASFAELAPEALAKIVKDCDAFISIFDQIESEVDHGQTPNWPDDEHAGRDFWYTRNGHGCGFWDGDWPEPYATALSEAARKFGSVDLYRGDDGLLYL